MSIVYILSKTTKFLLATFLCGHVEKCKFNHHSVLIRSGVISKATNLITPGNKFEKPPTQLHYIQCN